MYFIGWGDPKLASTKLKQSAGELEPSGDPDRDGHVRVLAPLVAERLLSELEPTPTSYNYAVSRTIRDLHSGRDSTANDASMPRDLVMMGAYPNEVLRAATDYLAQLAFGLDFAERVRLCREDPEAYLASLPPTQAAA